MTQQKAPDDFFTRHPALCATIITAVIFFGFVGALMSAGGHH